MIDPTRPVYLKQMVVDGKTGNTFPALNKPYQPGTLPVKFLTDEYCTQDEPDRIPVNTTEIKVNLRHGQETEPAPKELVPQVIKTVPVLKPETGEAINVTPTMPEPVVSPMVENPAIAPASELPPVLNVPSVTVSSGLKINDATRSEIEALDGIGPKAATKVLEERAKKPFADIADLNDRVPLPFKAKWDKYDLAF